MGLRKKLSQVLGMLRVSVLGLLGFAGILGFSISATAKSKVYVGAIKPISVSEEDAATIEELIKTSVIEDLKNSLATNASDSDYAISGRLVKLGEAYSLTLIKEKDSHEVFRTSLKASLMSDMDVVVKRLVRAIDNEESADKNAKVKDVTLDEEKNQRRRKEVLSQMTFAVGPASTRDMNVDGQSILWNLGYNYEVDYDWDMHLDLDWFTTNKRSEADAYYLALNFGLNYYFTEGNTSPFIEAHLGYGTATASTGCSNSALICSSKDRATGWIVGAGLGLRFFRTSNTNFGLVLRTSMLTNETDISGKRPVVGSLMLIGYFH